MSFTQIALNDEGYNNLCELYWAMTISVITVMDDHCIVARSITDSIWPSNGNSITCLCQSFTSILVTQPTETKTNGHTIEIQTNRRKTQKKTSLLSQKTSPHDFRMSTFCQR